MSHNPYTHAANVYGNNAKAATVDQRSLEGQILVKSAQQLENIQKRLQDGEVIALNEIDDVLSYNRKLWTVFASESVNDEHLLPQELKNNIASLSIFVFKRTVEILSDLHPDKFGALIDINRNIASGLLKAQENANTEIESGEEASMIPSKPKETELTDMQT